MPTDGGVVGKNRTGMSASEALYGFMGWLTSLEKPVTLSAGHDASIAAELVDEYCKANDLSDPRQDIEGLRKFPDTRYEVTGGDVHWWHAPCDRSVPALFRATFKKELVTCAECEEWIVDNI